MSLQHLTKLLAIKARLISMHSLSKPHDSLYRITQSLNPNQELLCITQLLNLSIDRAIIIIIIFLMSTIFSTNWLEIHYSCATFVL